jgi:hypothetical protein
MWTLEAQMQKALIIIGLACLAAGLLWPLIEKSGLGRLPGDIVVRKGSITFYFPLVTSILLSLLLTAILSFFRR